MGCRTIKYEIDGDSAVKVAGHDISDIDPVISARRI
jgi:hypothetical protein